MVRERRGVMLAHPMTDRKLALFPNKFFIQPKLNGERCRVEWFQGAPILLSSTGLEIPFLGHIKEALMDYPGRDWDGELYHHEKGREWIASVVSRSKNPHPEMEELQYHIFDVVRYDMLQAHRLVYLGVRKFESPVHLVPTYIAYKEQIIEWTNHFLELGYEGSILRHPLGEYETKRSNSMLKYKPTEKDLYVIMEVIEAVDKVGEKKGMVGAFKVFSPSSKDFFKVSAGKLSHSERYDLWERRGEITGGLLQVKHEKLKTKNQIPVSCVAVKVLGKEETNDFQKMAE